MNKSVAFVFLGLMVIIAVANVDGSLSTVQKVARLRGASHPMQALAPVGETAQCYTCDSPCSHGSCCPGSHPQCCINTQGVCGCCSV